MGDAMHAAISAIGHGTDALGVQAHQIANLATVKAVDAAPTETEAVVAAESATGGVRTVRVPATDSGATVYDPLHPLASPTGLVRHPSLDIAGAMAAANQAANLVRVNVVTLETALQLYRDATTVGASARARR